MRKVKNVVLTDLKIPGMLGQELAIEFDDGQQMKARVNDDGSLTVSGWRMISVRPEASNSLVVIMDEER